MAGHQNSKHHSTKIDADAIRAIQQAVSVGLSPEDAAPMIGVSPRTIQRWMKRGQEALEAGEADENGWIPSAERIFRKLYLQVQTSQAASKRGLLVKMHQAALDATTEPNLAFRAQTWLLERVHGLPSRSEVQVKEVGHTVEVSDADIAAALAIAAQAGATIPTNGHVNGKAAATNGVPGVDHDLPS
jgi:hypothetical protein